MPASAFRDSASRQDDGRGLAVGRGAGVYLPAASSCMLLIFMSWVR